MQSKVLVFDFDGVLADTLPVAREFTKWMYPGMTDDDYYRVSLQNFYTGIQEYQHLRRKISDSEYKNAQTNYFNAVSNVPLFDGIHSFFESIPKHISCVINSSAHADACIPILEKHGIAGKFSSIFTRDTADSKIEKFHMIAEKYNTSVSNMLFVTDSVGDIYEARQIAVPTIAVAWGLHSVSDLLGTGISVVTHTFDDLEYWTNQFFNELEKRFTV